jgi:hypothetical protein
MGMLYDRIIRQGTINEPEGKPEPQFALPSTVNWMKALALICADKSLEFSTAIQFYQASGKRQMVEHVENTVLEQLFLSLHHLSALERMSGINPTSDFARVGILTWYYGITNAASAMTAAKDGSFQEDHSGTARMWDAAIASQNLAMNPFDWRVTSLIEKVYKPEIAIFRDGSSGDLLHTPSTAKEALGAVAGYLSGSAGWYVWKHTEEVRNSKEYKALGVSGFRTKVARELRDNRLGAKTMGFVHQASRYRGKANYREALFLAYGTNTEATLDGFVKAQADVLRAFLAMAGAFCSRKLGKDIWNEFMDDVESSRAFTISPFSIWTKS